MTTKILTAGYLSGFYVGSPVTTLSIAPSGYVEGSGVTAGTGAYTIINSGFVENTDGGDGVFLSGGGTVTNGAVNDTTAQIIGYQVGVALGVSGTVQNFATLSTQSTGFINAAAVRINAAGVVINGGSNDKVALIEGEQGVEFFYSTGTVTNFGSILSTGPSQSAAVYIKDGGSVTNGSASDTTALISGDQAVLVRDGVLTVANFGSIISTAAERALNLYEGGTVTNGSVADTSAFIFGYGAVSSGGAAAVTNFGTIESVGAFAFGVALAGGTVVNGSATDHKALIEGYKGVGSYEGAATVTNAGTIRALGGSGDFGVSLTDGGSLTNGAVNNTTALVQGYGGAKLEGAVSGSNFGLIQGLGGGNYGSGLLFDSTGVFTNGSTGDKSATIEGYYGVLVGAAGTLINYGTISGANGESVQMTYGATLVVDLRSAFVGLVNVNTGTLVVGSGDGAVTDTYGLVTLSDSTPTVGFYNVYGLDIGAAAALTLTGTGSVGFNQTLTVAGELSAAGTINIAGGTFVESGVLSGAGVLNLEDGAIATFDTGANLAIAKVAESGSTTTANFDGATITVADVWTQTAGTVSAATGNRVNFTDKGDTFSGTLGGAGTIGFTGGTDALSGTTLSATSVVIDGATVTLSGTVDLTKTLSVTSPDVLIATAGASLTGGGIVSLSDATTNIIKGASASAVLTNVDDKIEGAGDLGDGEMGLTNDAGGTIDAYLGAALTINLGANTLTNAGLIENAGTGGTTIDGATDNTGTLEAIKGTLTVDGAVTGAGTVKIAGGTADFASTFTENVAFTSAGGVLELADATTYTGTITGFAKTSITSLDLTDIAFTGATVSYSGTTASGVLTVKSGANTAKINLTGDYLTSTFTLSKDAGSGTIVTDPPGKPPITTLPLIAAMAGFGGADGVSHALTAEAAHLPPIALAAPGAAIA
jgi:hypothetical protein